MLSVVTEGDSVGPTRVKDATNPRGMFGRAGRAPFRFADRNEGLIIGFMDAVKSVILKRFLDFQGRSPRSEYWWFFVFTIVLYLVTMAAMAILPILGIIFAIGFIVLIIPSLAVAIRRFHDIDKSGWWILVGFIPIVGFILMIYFFTQKGTEGDNRFGPDPLAGMHA